MGQRGSLCWSGILGGMKRVLFNTLLASDTSAAYERTTKQEGTRASPTLKVEHAKKSRWKMGQHIKKKHNRRDCFAQMQNTIVMVAQLQTLHTRFFVPCLSNRYDGSVETKPRRHGHAHSGKCLPNRGWHGWTWVQVYPLICSSWLQTRLL